MIDRAPFATSLLAALASLIVAPTPAPTFASTLAPPAPANHPSPAAAHDIDLRPLLNRLGLTPREQGARGTCSVFAVTQAIEYAAATRSHKGERLSVEFLNWASNKATASAADGGFFSEIWAGFEKYGICTEKDAPYRAAFDPAFTPAEIAQQSARSLRDSGLLLHWIKPWDVTTGLTPSHIEAIKATLRRNWPVCAGMRWPIKDAFSDDLLNTPSPQYVRDGHSVLIVAYHDDPSLPGGGAFTFRNTNNAGSDGRMTYDYASRYVNDAAWIESLPELRTDLIGPPAAPILGRNRRVSSNMQPGWHTENLDMTWLNPGESIEMPLLEGPGVLTHLWFTSHAGWTHELDALRLRIYWDARTDPGIDVPLGDFFAVGQGTPAVVESVPIQVSPTGGLTSFWRMPFAKSAKIVVTNEHTGRGTGLYWQADWTQVKEIPEGTPYFHATYRHEYPAAAGKDFTIAQLTGRGLYVGSVLSVTSVQEGWFGEGDDFFYIDGEETPSLQGTGTEDYFNDAWGFRPRTSQWFGSPRWDGDAAGDSGVCYRWHWGDAVNFHKSLKVAIEHKGNLADDTAGFFIERPDFYSSVAMWYQLGEPAPTPAMVPWPQRRVPWVHHHALKAMNAIKTFDGVPLKVIANGLFGARPTLLWPTTTVGATLSMPIEIAADGRYAVRVAASRGAEYGVFDAELDGKKVATIDLRPSPATPSGEADVLLGTFVLTKGTHTIAFRVAEAVGGASASGSGGGAVGGGKALALELIRTLKLPPEVVREVKTHHEAHFVRLGIGRALYAHRLAYGTLPFTLKELVDKGLMTDRYLSDENNRPLLFRREGDLFVVESTEGEKWVKRWTGLDPRR